MVHQLDKFERPFVYYVVFKCFYVSHSGYMAPEYAMQGMFSVKSDVYSFGVLVLEIVSGRRNSSFHEIEGPLSIVEYVSFCEYIAYSFISKSSICSKELKYVCRRGSCGEKTVH